MSEWRTVPGWERYYVSNEGGVFDAINRTMLQIGDYQRVVLYKSRVRSGRKVSPGRLVLEAFVGPCPEGMECCHWDDNRLNNHISNVRWGTRGDNITDAYRNGRGDKSGEKNGCAVMTEANVLEAIELRKTDVKAWPYYRLGERYGVSAQAVFAAVKGKKWKKLHRKEGETLISK